MIFSGGLLSSGVTKGLFYEFIARYYVLKIAIIAILCELYFLRVVVLCLKTDIIRLMTISLTGFQDKS